SALTISPPKRCARAMPSAVLPLAVGPSTTISGRCSASDAASGCGSGDASALCSVADHTTPADLPRHGMRDDLHADVCPIEGDGGDVDAPWHGIERLVVQVSLRQLEQARLLASVDALQRQSARFGQRARSEE